jgi:glutamate 5-kinase
MYCNYNKVIHKQLLAALGQVELMHTYATIFEKFNCICAQVLATKEDFRSRKHYLNMKNCFAALLQDKVIPIVNENDVVSVTELMFTDNDELAGMIASMLNVDSLIMLTSVDGVFDGDPDDPNSKVIPVIDHKKTKCEKFILRKKSSRGMGGMLTKCRIAQTLSAVGIPTYIVNGAQKNILLDIIEGKKVGTHFIPQKKVSSVKKWIALTKGYEKGSVYIDKKAETALTEKVCSLLPVGIIKIEGSFEKGDIIRIVNEDNKFLGLGMSEYSSKEGKEIIGEKGKKPLIHYDYLFIY